MALKWLDVVHSAWQKQTVIEGHKMNPMFEKLSVQQGKSAGGGEYPNQVGFAWTNGVALDFISRFCCTESYH